MYQQIVIPEAVVTELSEKRDLFPKAANVPDLEFIHVEQPENEVLVRELERELHAGEAACLALALETGDTSRLILDDVAARNAAEYHNVLFVGTLGILLEAKSKGIIPSIAALVADLRTKARFWIHSDLEKAVLKAANESV